MLWGESHGIVLVVDDDEAVLSLMQTYLAAAGIRVETVTSARDALTRLAAGGIALVVTDYYMPVMDGVTLSRTIGTRFPTTPVVFVTAHDEDLNGSGIPNYAILQKPLDRQAFVEFVRRALRDIRQDSRVEEVVVAVDGIRADVSTLTLSVQGHLRETTRAVEGIAAVAAGAVSKVESFRVWPELWRPFKHRAVAAVLGVLVTALGGLVVAVYGYIMNRDRALHEMERTVPAVERRASRLEENFGEIKAEQKLIRVGIDDLRGPRRPR